MPYDGNGEWYDDPEITQPGPADVPNPGDAATGPQPWAPGYDPAAHGQDPTSGQPTGGTTSQPAPLNEDYFKNATKGDGAYDPNVYQEYLKDPTQGWADRLVNKENLRADNEVGSTYHEDGKGGYLTPPKAAVAPSSTLLGKPGSGVGSGGSNLGGSLSGDNIGFSLGGSNPGSTSSMDDMMGYLKGLFPGGGLNQDVINRRVDNARSQLEATKRSTQKNNEAYLADRGLIGSGPQSDAETSLNSRLFGQFGQSMNDIYANEEQNADQRMIASLQAATGLSEAEAANVVAQYNASTGRQVANTGQYNAETNRTGVNNDYTLGLGNLALGNKNADNNFTLGKGNLALGNLNATNNYSLGAGNLQLDRDKLAQLIQSGNTDAMLRYIELMMQGAQTSSGGYL